jgi:Tol biopolymer transport system component
VSVFWAPDDRSILFTAESPDDAGTILFSRPSNGLWTMDADGGRPTRLPLTGAGHALTVISADWRL